MKNQKLIKNTGIAQNGANTHHQDQLIAPTSLRIIKTIPTTVKILVPDFLISISL